MAPCRMGAIKVSLIFWLFIGCCCIWLIPAEEVVRIDSSQEEELFDTYGNDQFREFSAGKGEKGLFPSIFNLATHAEIRATATCGQNGPDYYCKLVEHVFLRQPQCDICDANNHHKNHPIDYAIDGTRRWWQSPTLSNGLSFERVNITLDLRQIYQVAYVIVKAAISPRPGTWVLEKSLDGTEFSPWQYFAASDSECMRHFGVPASTGVPKFGRDDEVLCTSYFSKLNPLEFGEIHISLVNGRPGAEKSTQGLQQFTRARFVRLRLIGLKTLYADLMVINQRDKRLDHSVTRRYFYTISDISIGGQCICYGHAERCTPDVVHGQFRCECRHNTCGESCSECCPLFNQLPWRVGTHDHPNFCQACQCFNHAHRCEYDAEVERQRQSVTPEGIYEGGGRCVECQHNTEGVNCEKCRAEFYRPANISHYRHDACRPCDCDPVGAESDQCVRDETEAAEGLRPGDCRCRPGFGGRRCDRCALGYRNHPICEPCPCHQAGSLNFETCEEEHCVCKPNVEGEHCDRCRPGTIYLDKDNPQGCQPCFCFGKSSECREFFWSTGQISNRTGWKLTDLQGQLNVPQRTADGLEEEEEENGGQLLIFNAEDRERDGQAPLYYWKAPSAFLGNRLNSFASNLHYYVYFVPHEPTRGQPTPIADVIIEGNGAKLEFYSRLNFFPRENISVSVPLKPIDNWYDARTRRPVDKAAMMRVLADMTALWVRARYHQDQLQSSIYGLRMETAFDATGTGTDPSQQRMGKVHPVEVCVCPEHFEGNSCERCESGYRRVNNQLYDGTCKRCECQGHSDQCDPFTGNCLQCQHNTTGARCELCQPAFYGNPSLGGLFGQCRPCACPTVEHSHSAECTLSQLVLDGAAAAGEDEYVCTACEPGYDGNKCEICADGYFGDPFASDPADACRPCECSGNIDPAAIGNCDRMTGECLRCISHTTGPQCEYCLENHWGSPLLHTCRACRCHPIGAISPQCSNETGGQCECHPGYTGARCDSCVAGHGDVENGCPECQCNSIGSLGAACDDVSGQCVCKKGVYGKRCDMCVPSYYNFGPEGCQYCHCNEFGAIDGRECHNVTGECQCQPHVHGLKCEQCEEGFFNLSSAQGCQPCRCDSTGSVGDDCDERSGQCRCKPGVAGPKCDECEPNYYGFGPDGCKQCRVCPAPGQVCDAVSGECVCPPNTQGEMCEHCTQNAWNYHPYRGCQLCECDGIGADSQICDERTGQCKCKSGYVGHRCDLCEPGYYAFPDCRPCECDLAGTEQGECRGTTCLCSNAGQCQCRKNVRGAKCDECADGAFSLEAWNPLGCTECFCFGRSASCGQAEQLVWRQTYAPDRRAHFDAPFDMFERKHNLHVLKESPPEYNSYPTNHTPLYWPMPESFKHDRTGSYAGFLRFRIRNEDNRRGGGNVLQPDAHTFRLFPQVVLIGNTRIELEHLPEKLGGEDGKYKVRFHESQWRNRISPQVPVTRKQMMIALLNVQHIFIRATYNDMYRGDAIAISEVSLDVATEAGGGGDAAAPALGIEQCVDCAEGWTGRSCQDPALGFHLFFQPGHLNMPDDIVLAGIAKPCACHGHSSACDPRTGECIDCQHNTVGTHCERCRDGYYGNALSGSPDACHRCACPLADNTFSPTCRQSESTGRGYICDGCRPGYAGDYCESCEPGYYGNPALSNGFCALCACHPHGSVDAVCHNVTGQCHCRQGVDGRDCSSCSPRHAFLNGLCTSCDRGCYRDLMMAEDEMEYAIGPVQVLLSDARPIPRKRLARIAASIASLDSLLDSIGKGQEGGGGGGMIGPEEFLFPDDDGGGDELGGGESRPLRQARRLVQEFQLLQERNNDSMAKLKEMDGELARMRAKVQAENRRVVDIVNQLAQFSRRSNQTPPGQINHLLGQAEALLGATRDRVASIEKKYNYAKKNAEDAERLLKEIMARKLNSTSYEQLAQKHQQHQALLRDFRDAIWDEARAGSLAAMSVSQQAKNELDRLEKTIGEIGQFGRMAEEELANGRKNVEQIRRLGEGIGDMQKELSDTLIPAARSQRQEGLQPLEGQLEALEELRRTKMVEAGKHAQELEEQARTLKGRFAETQVFSTDALAASNAYQSIAVALQNATAAAEAAKRNADQAFAVIDPQSEGSLATLANTSAAKSAELNARVDATLESLGVREQNGRLEKTLEEMEGRMQQAQRNMSVIKDVQQLLEDHHDRINTVYAAVDEAHAGLGDIEETVMEFNDAVGELKQRADLVQQFTSASIQESIRNLTETGGEFAEMEKAFAQLRARTDEHAAQFKQVRADLGVLKEKIDEAREKAAKIRIGVRSEPGSECVREYISPMRPSPSNTILIKYRPAMDTPDSLLFFTLVQGTRTQHREFMAVELKQKKIHVHWDIGGGKRTGAIIKRNIVYIPASDRHTWYHIEVKRVANSMQVSVVQRQTLGGGEGTRDVDEPSQVVVGEPKVVSEVIFNTVPGQTRLSLGVADREMARELDIDTHHFHGTVGELNVDGVNVPLWAFANTHGACDGATGPPSKMASGHMFRDGFAQVRMQMAERTSTMLTVQFSAYSPNGLLYFRGSAQTGEFLALELNEGAVAVKADFGPEAKIALQSNGSKFADGRPHKVRVIRKDGEVHLQVDPEADHVSIALADGQALLDIAEPDHFVGGVPPDFPRHEFTLDHDIHFGGFFGCIHSVRPNQVSELDLDNALRAQRKEAGCRYSEERLATTERVIGFEGLPNGFLKTRGVLLDTESTLAFNFRTRSANALLLYESADLQRDEKAQKEARRRRRRRMRRKGRGAAEFLSVIVGEGGRGKRAAVDPDDRSFLAIYLIGGRLTVHLGTDSQERVKSPVISSTQTYNDGLLHSVFLSREAKEIQVRMDDREVLATVLVDEQQPIGGAHWTMLLGGVPQRLAGLVEQQSDGIGTGQPLAGCLSDFQLNYDRLPILLEEHRGAALGSCSLEDGTNELETGKTQEEEEKAQTTVVPVPAKDAPFEKAEEGGGEEEAEEGTKQQFHRKKSRQSLEPVAPTMRQSATMSAAALAGRPKEPLQEAQMAPPQCSQESLATSQMAFSEEAVHREGVRFGVAESSHARINFEPFALPDQANFSLEFEFRTTHRQGLLWAWANFRNYTRFFLLHLDRGFIQLEMRHHKQPKTLHYRARRFNDGKWHRLALAKEERRVRLAVDDLPAETVGDAPNPRVTRKRMYVGGVIGRHRRKFQAANGGDEREMPPAFQGCLRHFRVNGIEHNLLLASRDLLPCAHSPNVAYVHRGGFATFGSFNIHQKRWQKGKEGQQKDGLELGLRFRLMPEGIENGMRGVDEDGEEGGKGRMLIGMMSPRDKAFLDSRLALWVDDENRGALAIDVRIARWHLNFHAVFDEFGGAQNYSSSSPSSSQPPPPLLVCVGQWHHLRLAISSHSGIAISLDGQKQHLDLLHIPAGAIHELRSLPLQLGGTNVPISASLGTRSLLGCVKQFELDGQPVAMEMKAAKKWHKMVEDGCPGA